MLEVRHLQEALEPIEVAPQHAEQWGLIKIEHTEQVEVPERYLDIIAHREVAKPTEEQYLVAAPLEVAHLLQDIVAREVIPQEHLPIEAREVELEAMVMVLEHNQGAEAQHLVEAHIDQVVRAEAVVEATVHQAALVEAQVAPEVRAVHHAPLEEVDHQAEDLVVVEVDNKTRKFH